MSDDEKKDPKPEEKQEEEPKKKKLSARKEAQILAGKTLEEGIPKPALGKLCITFLIIAVVGLCLFLLFFFLFGVFLLFFFLFRVEQCLSRRGVHYIVNEPGRYVMLSC